ncbi:TRAP transporter, DctM subunit [Sulfitobacter brevis]|uniref:TRAP transporter large permease protein n=1 Tax=Sulfitobacter brevis TaxID=74348 RepID=A0A1I2BXY1_9RHOB|nr:TRAP transporter large permease [Sulfitobacter brevis]SFE60313.1 TRAP transporter, DctM subunit [Sulfitobacter brevis]
MDPLIVGLLALAVTVFLLAIRVPIAAALGISASIGVFIIFAWRPGGEFVAAYAWRPTLSLIANGPYDFLKSYSLATVPLFILMGHLAYEAGFTTDIYRAARLWLARLPGGVAMASVLGCGGFSAITGSSVACAAAMGRIAIPEMLKFGYSKSLASGSVAIGGTLGSLIPPSILFILFGIFAEQSIAKLFMAAIIPGLLSLLAYMLVIFIWVSLRPEAAPRPTETITNADRWRSLGKCWSIVVLFVVVIGGIYAGYFTPSQAAGVGAYAALALGLLLGRLNFSKIAAALKESVYQSSMIFAIALAGKIYVSFIALTGLSGAIGDWIATSDASLALVLLLIVILYLVLGMFLDSIGIILLTLPLTIPIIQGFDLSLIWFGVVVVKLLEIGLVTPPIGLNVFVIKSIVGTQIKLETIFKGIGVFLIAEVFVLGLIVCVPAVSLWLPSVLQ